MSETTSMSDAPLARPQDAASDLGSGDAVTLTRGLAILEALASTDSSNGVTHAAIARHVGMSRSTLYRYLGALQEAGYVEGDAHSHRYRLGPRLQSLAASPARESAFAQRALGYSRKAAVSADEHAQAMVFSRGRAVMIAVAPVAHSYGRIGTLTADRAGDPAHCSAAGKLFIAWDGERLPDCYWDRPFDAHTDTTITDPDRLWTQLDQVKRQGYATDRGEYFDGISCVAAPVFDAPGRIVGALAVAVEAAALQEKVAASLAAKIIPIAERFSDDLQAATQHRQFGPIGPTDPFGHGLSGPAVSTRDEDPPPAS